MRIVNRSPLLFYLSIAMFCISSAAIALMPFWSFGTSERDSAVATALAVVFWLGIIAGVVLLQIVGKRRRWDNKFHSEGSTLQNFLSFFSCMPVIIFDTAFILGVLITSASLIYREVPEWLAWEAIFMAVLSFELHCIFTGKNCKWMKFCRSLKK